MNDAKMMGRSDAARNRRLKKHCRGRAENRMGERETVMREIPQEVTRPRWKPKAGHPLSLNLAAL
jgi:hypothetical protein